MKAQFVNENISFERGQDPKDALQIGEWGIKRALLNQEPYPVGSLEYDAQKDWWKNGGIPEEFKKEIGYSGDPNEYVGFDDDYYLETEVPEWVDPDEFHGNFTPIGGRKKVRNENGWGIFQWQKGQLPDGTVVYHYVDGMSSGYITRREWLKGDK